MISIPKYVSNSDTNETSRIPSLISQGMGTEQASVVLFTEDCF